MSRKRFYLILFALVLSLGVVAQGKLVHRYSFTDGDTTAVDSVAAGTAPWKARQ